MNNTLAYKPRHHPYFYRDQNNELQKYFYCSLCDAGPFTNEQVLNGQLKPIAGDKNVIHYCPNCIRVQRINKEPESPKTIVAPFVKKKTKKSSLLTNFEKEIDTYKNEEKLDEHKAIVFFAKGIDGTIFCSEHNNPRVMLENMNKTTSQSGLRKQSFPFELKQQLEVSKIEAKELISKFRHMTKINKEKYIAQLGGN